MTWPMTLKHWEDGLRAAMLSLSLRSKAKTAPCKTRIPLPQVFSNTGRTFGGVTRKLPRKKLLIGWRPQAIVRLLRWIGSHPLRNFSGTSFVKLEGAAGAEGFSGDELKHIPRQAVSEFRRNALLWETKGNVPPSLFHARMVNLAKPHKVAPDGTVALENCRPITVLATWWRLWGSAWIQTPAVQKWIATLPETVVCGKGSDAQLTAAQLYQELSRKRYAASLDFTKCYDLMVPEGTIRLLLQGGWPQGICALIRQVWTQQIRWVSWRQHTAPQPLRAGTCCPQGCSFGPLALAVWMAAGARAVQDQFTEIFMRIYMDDRSLVASSASALMGMVRRWGDWSSHVGSHGVYGKNSGYGGFASATRGVERGCTVHDHGCELS